VNKQKEVNARRQRRRFHNRKKVQGSAQRPRLCICRSLKHIGCQLVDDFNGKTLVSASTLDKDVRDQVAYGGNKAAAAAIGKQIAEKALAAGIDSVRFDRGHGKYHGRIAALADAAREAGLKF
jgi:large subunit ribosomal protein L18